MRIRRLLVILLALAARAPAAAPSFAGTWQTTFGIMRLAQKGAEVDGTCLSGETLCALKGVLKGNRLEFTYREPRARGKGWFILAADGTSFAGKWLQQGTARWHPWDGRRIEDKAPGQATFDGLWATSFGTMRLVRDGDQVRGICAYAGGCELTGKVKGRKLAFQYREPTANGEGWFELSPDRQSLVGKWRQAGKEAWGDWRAARIRPRPGRVWLVVVEARWEGGLQQQEYSFGAMLRAFFARSPLVQVRHRFFAGKDAFRRWCREAAYLAEPVVLCIASHGDAAGLRIPGHTITPEDVADALRYATNLRLLHLSSCLMMQDKLAARLVKRLGRDVGFPISGYAKPVDWAGCAVLEFLYFDLVLLRGMPPKKAAAQIRILLPFCGERDLPGAVIKSPAFRIITPG